MSDSLPAVRGSGQISRLVQSPPAADVRNPAPPSARYDPPAGSPVRLDRRQLDELTDMVVERIEQRVVDELERRGRRNVRGGF